jgi:hypothetical protein
MRLSSNSTGNGFVPGAPNQGAVLSGEKFPYKELIKTGLPVKII